LVEQLPALAGREFDRMVDLFAAVLLEVLRLDINLYIHQWALHRDGDDDVIAMEIVDDHTAEECVYVVRDWFRALNAGESYDWRKQLRRLQVLFDRSLLGGPTIYSLVEAGWKRSIPVLYLPTENSFQWGYGRKGIRGRSTVFHTDSVKDTEFTTFKDRVKEFLGGMGFPVPKGFTCDTEEEIVELAAEVGYPVVVKPVAGHKGKGVSTNLRNAEEVAAAFRRIHAASGEDEATDDGVIVESFIQGSDYRLLTVNGKFVAGLHRQPAYVIGDGRRTIAELIDEENETPARLDTIRSPLCKIVIDQSVHDFLTDQGLTLSSIPSSAQRINLRKIANISAGGSSINVTDQVHPLNRDLVENIASFFRVTCMGIDVIAGDISKPWTDGNFGIIEINAGPGVFMHTAPAVGAPIDVPGLVMEAFFANAAAARIPIVAGNNLSPKLCAGLRARIAQANAALGVATLDATQSIFLNGRALASGLSHRHSILTILRHPSTDFAIISHDKDGIFDDGTVHAGADVVILREPHYAEQILERDLLPGGILVTAVDGHLLVRRDGQQVGHLLIDPAADLDDLIVMAIAPFLPRLIESYR
jgi:cyanophycin synthetase